MADPGLGGYEAFFEESNELPLIYSILTVRNNHLPGVPFSNILHTPSLRTQSQKLPPGSHISLTKNILQVLLKSIFPDAKGLGNFIIVAVLVDLFGNLEFTVCEVAGVFQVGESLFEVVGLRLTVGDLVEDGV